MQFMPNESLHHKIISVYAIYFAGFYFREFRESGAIHEFNNTQK